MTEREREALAAVVAWWLAGERMSERSGPAEHVSMSERYHAMEAAVKALIEERAATPRPPSVSSTI